MTEEQKCPHGCIFYPNSNTLLGDCRRPELETCCLNVLEKRTRAHEEILATVPYPGF